MNLLLVPLMLWAQQVKPERVGSIEYQPPSGWTKQEKTGLWTKGADVLFGWVGVAPASSDPLEKQFTAYLAAKDKKSGAKSLKASPVQTLEMAAGSLKGVCVGRELQAGGIRAFVMDAVVLADCKLHAFMFAAPDAEKFQSILDKEIVPMVQGAKAAAAPAAGEKQTIEPLKFAGPTQQIGCFCFSTPVPADWKIEEGKTSSVIVLQSPRTVGKKPITHPIVCQAIVGTVKDARAALDTWLQRAAAMVSDVEATPALREIAGCVEWRVTTGGDGTSMNINVYDDKKRFLYRAFGAMFAKDGVIVLMGSGFGLTREFWALSAEERKEVGEQHKLFGDIGAALSNTRCELPPLLEDAAKSLVATKSYFWHLKWYSSSGTGAQKSFSSGTSSTQWKFHADRTCEMESKDFSYFTRKTMANPWGGLGPGILTQGDADRQTRDRFEVRGKGAKDLWIVVYRKGGLTSFHTLDFNAESEYGESKPKGLAIDNFIEGDYFTSDDTSDFKDEHKQFWRAYK